MLARLFKKELLRIQADQSMHVLPVLYQAISDIKMLKEGVGRKEEELFWTGMKREEVLDDLQRQFASMTMLLYQERFRGSTKMRRPSKARAL